MVRHIHPVLLCGGSGSRLWPVSRKSYPKQFAPLTGAESLFQSSARRLSGPEFAPPVVVTGEAFRFIVIEQLAAVEIAPGAVLIEPEARNTAPEILAAALRLEAQTEGALMLVAPSDHVIPDPERFREAALAAAPAAEDGFLVTFGIRPDRAETGYGWLELAEAPGTDFAPVPQPLARFVEKPSEAVAREMLDGGRHLWNAGIFLFHTDTLIAAFEAYQPEMLAQVRTASEHAERDLGFTRLAPEPWAEIEENSIDYAVMEKASNLSVVPYGGTWSDLGGWEAVWRDSGPDDAGVVAHGSVTAIDCENALLRSEAESQQLVGLGLKDIVAIAMPELCLLPIKTARRRSST